MWLRDGMSITESIATFALFHDPDLKWAAKEGPLKFFFIPFLRSCVRVRQIVYEANIFDEEDVHRYEFRIHITRYVRNYLLYVLYSSKIV